MSNRIGIHSIGVYLPDEIRTNDWWPRAVVDQWVSKAARSSALFGKWIEKLQREAEKAGVSRDLSSGMQRTLAAMNAHAHDPFRGSVERRVIPNGMLSSEMETIAAERAIAAAGIDPKEIDFLLSYSSVPDYLNAPNACLLHKKLGLPARCLATAIEGACNSFLLQLGLAEQLIEGGRARYGLLIQSCTGSILFPPDSQDSVSFGDGATAVIVGPVSDGRGLASIEHRVDGSRHNALVIGVPGGRWYDEGRAHAYIADPQAAIHMLLTIADRAVEVVDAALVAASATRPDVSFYAGHQGAVWLRQVTQEQLALDHARTVDTFKWASSLSASNVPLILATAEREGLLKDGELALLFAGGSGETWTAATLRWGRG